MALLFLSLTMGSFKSILANEASLKQICESFYIEKKSFSLFSGVSFSKNEKILICGDEQSSTWSKIPRWQAMDNLKNFLKSRGYFSPVFDENEDKVIVYQGEKSLIKSLKFLNTPEGFGQFEFLGIKNEILSSQSLDRIESWAKVKLEQLGYPCPRLKTQADPSSGSVTVTLEVDERSVIESLEREVPPGVRKKALSRFDAFDVGDHYNGRNLTLTSRRVRTSGVADYSDFSTNCTIKGTNRTFKQRITYSKPQSVTLAIGGTTEQLPIVKLSWKHSRLDQNASQMSTRLFLSSVEQSVSGNLQWHVFNNAPRFYFLPEFKVARYSEPVYTSLNQVLSYGLGYMHDDSAKRILLSSKPTYTIEDRTDGEGPSHTEFLSLESSISIFNHEFEYNQQAPKSGYELGFNWSLRQKGLGSDLSGNLYKLRGTYLHNWGGFDPPLYVLGFRFQYSVLTTESLNNTPSRLRLFLGGDNDIRGFSRKSINNENFGFLTTGYIGSELRFLKVLPYGLQPFVFLDLAQVGLSSFEFDSKLLWAPGLGLRWQSPVGPVRATLAKGIVEGSSDYDIEEQWTFFLSLGSEF